MCVWGGVCGGLVMKSSGVHILPEQKLLSRFMLHFPPSQFSYDEYIDQILSAGR